MNTSNTLCQELVIFRMDVIHWNVEKAANPSFCAGSHAAYRSIYTTHKDELNLWREIGRDEPGPKILLGVDQEQALFMPGERTDSSAYQIISTK